MHVLVTRTVEEFNREDSALQKRLIGRIRSEEMYVQVLSAFQATPRKTIIAENSIHTIKPIAAASPP